ncbi:MAG TPA: universal stress protein [Ktedonobacteraceae bacterium]
MVRVLLPFTHGIDSVAITSALALAQRLNATLMLLSLISQPQKPGKSPRWEAIQQSRDFLTFASHRATRLGVPVEQVELYTQLASRSIRTFAQEMECAGIVLTVRGGAGVLLATHEVKQLLEERGIPLYVVSLPGRPTVFSALPWLPQWLGRKTPHAASPHHVLRRQTLSCQTDHQLHDSTVLKDS